MRPPDASASGGARFFCCALFCKDRIRITQSTLIGLSTLTRLAFLLLAGVYADLAILTMALFLSTAMLCGVYAGRRITLRLSREQFIKVVNVLVLFSGVFLLIRYFSSPL